MVVSERLLSRNVLYLVKYGAKVAQKEKRNKTNGKKVWVGERGL